MIRVFDSLIIIYDLGKIIFPFVPTARIILDDDDDDGANASQR